MGGWIRSIPIFQILVHAAAWYIPVHGDVKTEFTGNEYFKERRIKRQLPSLPENADAAAIRDWMDQVRGMLFRMYEDEGFFEATIEAKLGSLDGDWDAGFAIHEGPRYHVDSVRILGDGDLPEPKVVQEGGLNPGDPFSQERLQHAKLAVLEASGNGGYMHSRVVEHLDFDTSGNTVTVEFLVHSGRFVLFDTLIIRNRREAPWDSLAGVTRNSLIHSLVTYERGDTVRFRENDRFIDKLQATGAFEYVGVEDSLLPDGRSALILNAVEERPGRLRASLFYDTDFLLGETADFGHGNLSGTLNEVGSGVTLAQEKQNVHAHYGSALTLGYLLRFDNELESNRYQSDPVHEALETPPFRGDFEFRNSARLSRNLLRWLQLLGSFDLLFRSHVLDMEARQRGWSISLSPSAFLTFLDNPLRPIRGGRFAFSSGIGTDFPGQGQAYPSDYLHSWLEGFSAYYYPLFIPEVVMAARLDGGRFFGRPDIGVPRFYLGGPRTARSFPFKSICPLKRAVQAGEEMVEVCLEDGIVPANVLASLELRIQLFEFGGIRDRAPCWLRALHAAPFVDAGKVWDLRRSLENTSSEGEGIFYGLGSRYPLFSIFNVRLDFAWGMDGAGNRNFAWVVDLAHAF